MIRFQGLLHANRGGDRATMLLDATSSDNEIVQHGACLGLGINAMATQNAAIYERLQVTRYTTHRLNAYVDLRFAHVGAIRLHEAT